MGTDTKPYEQHAREA